MHEHLQELEQFIVAAVPAIWLSTYEEKRTLEMLAGIRDERQYSLIEWDILQGAKIRYASGDESVNALLSNDGLAGCDDPVAMLRKFTEFEARGLVLIMQDMHRFIKSAEVVRAIKLFINSDPIQKHVIFMSHTNAIPEELEKDVLLAHIKLPGEDDIRGVVDTLISENELECEASKEHVQAVLGLTQQELQNAFSLNLVEDMTLSREKLEKFKLEAVKKSGMMEIFPPVAENELGGLDLLKEYMRLRALGFDDPNLPTPTGILLMGLPGGGKSLSAKVIASMLKMPLIKLDIASLKSKYVGESESKMGQALNLIDAVSPAVVWLDK